MTARAGDDDKEFRRAVPPHRQDGRPILPSPARRAVFDVFLVLVTVTAGAAQGEDGRMRLPRSVGSELQSLKMAPVLTTQRSYFFTRTISPPPLRMPQASESWILPKVTTTSSGTRASSSRHLPLATPLAYDEALIVFLITSIWEILIAVCHVPRRHRLCPRGRRRPPAQRHAHRPLRPGPGGGVVDAQAAVPQKTKLGRGGTSRPKEPR